MATSGWVAIYVRVSTREQADAFSLDGQEAALRNDAKRRGKLVYRVYRDAGVSGFREDRAELNKLLADGRQGSFGEVIVWSVSRISRKLSYLLAVIEELSRYGIAVRSLSENFDAATPTGKLALSSMGAIAEMQRSSWMESSSIASKQRNRGGRWNGGTVLGYTSVPDPSDPRGGTMLVVVPDEAATVVEIYRLCAGGYGLRAIVSRLNMDRKTGKAGKPFSISTVRTILKNPLYAGKVRYRDQIEEGIHQPFVDRELWDEVQSLLENRSKAVVKTIERDSFLSGILCCPECGVGMVPSHVKSRRVDGTFRLNYYYACSAYLNRGSAVCHANSVRAETAEAKVLGWVKEILSSPFWLAQVADEIHRRLGEEVAPQEAERNKIRDNLTDLAKRQRLLLAQYEDGTLPKEAFMAEAQELKIEKEKLLARLESTGGEDKAIHWTKADIKAAFRDMRQVLAKAPASKKRELVRALVDKVRVNGHRQVSELELKVPLPVVAGQEVLVVPLSKAK